MHGTLPRAPSAPHLCTHMFTLRDHLAELRGEWVKPKPKHTHTHTHTQRERETHTHATPHPHITQMMILTVVNVDAIHLDPGKGKGPPPPGWDGFTPAPVTAPGALFRGCTTPNCGTGCSTTYCALECETTLCGDGCSGDLCSYACDGLACGNVCSGNQCAPPLLFFARKHILRSILRSIDKRRNECLYSLMSLTLRSCSTSLQVRTPALSSIAVTVVVVVAVLPIVWAIRVDCFALVLGVQLNAKVSTVAGASIRTSCCCFHCVPLCLFISVVDLDHQLE